MKILWVNPSFLDYRVPVYSELYNLTQTNFFIVYSKNRVLTRVINKIENSIGSNAIGLSKEYTLSFGAKNEFSNRSILLPFPIGLWKVIKAIRADIIISEGFFQWTPLAALYSILFRKPLLISYERTSHTERNCPIWRTLYRKTIDVFVTAYLVNGLLTEEYLLKIGIKDKFIYKGCMAADSALLKNQIKSISNFEIEKAKNQVNLGKGITFLFVGRIIELKGVKELLQAWNIYNRRYAEDNLLIVGPGNLLNNCDSGFQNSKGVYIMGEINYDEIYKYYAIADVFIIPTLEDNWSLVVPEAMACSLPIACSIYNGCFPELIQERKNGKLFDPLNQNSIIEALKYFHNNKNILKKMGRLSNKIEQEYSPLKCAQRIYNACVQNRFH